LEAHVDRMSSDRTDKQTNKKSTHRMKMLERWKDCVLKYHYQANDTTFVEDDKNTVLTLCKGDDYVCVCVTFIFIRII
jgi:hypothetical protein